MAFHCVTTCSNCVIINHTEKSFLSKQSAMSAYKRVGFLSPNRISELVWDSESKEAGASSNIISEVELSFQDKPGVFFRVGKA
jgi:hypothetical protein